LRGSIGSLNREGRERLRTAFEEVDGHFRELFTRLFQGGQAHLALIDSDDPLEAGLEIFAQPPGKRLQSLSLLSGDAPTVWSDHGGKGRLAPRQCRSGRSGIDGGRVAHSKPSRAA